MTAWRESSGAQNSNTICAKWNTRELLAVDQWLFLSSVGMMVRSARLRGKVGVTGSCNGKIMYAFGGGARAKERDGRQKRVSRR